MKEKRKNLQVSCNNFYVVTKDSWHFSPSVSFSDFRITSSPGRPAGYVVPNGQTHTCVSLKTVPLYFGKSACFGGPSVMIFIQVMWNILWSRCAALQLLIILHFCLYQKETFEGLSQEALSLCIQSLKTASALIAQRKVKNYKYTYIY